MKDLIVRSKPILYGRTEQPLGRSWEEWTVLWWKWVLSIPINKNPGFDDTGNAYKYYPHVWSTNGCFSSDNVIFLVGNYGGSTKRHYKISHGKSILFPIINFTTSFAEEPYLKTKDELINRARTDIDDIVYKYSSIDMRIIGNMDDYRVASPPFDIFLPEDNVFKAKPGLTKAVSDGYWIFLKPLTKGHHIIHTCGSCSSGKTSIDMTWNLLIQ